MLKLKDSLTAYKRQQITDYTVGGFGLFPCGQAKDPKAPAWAGWQNAKADVFVDPDEFPDAYGVALTEFDALLDVDPRRYESSADQHNQLLNFWSRYKLPRAETLIVQTPGGGVHIYFKKPKDFAIMGGSTVPGFPAIEVKTRGQFVVAAGSVLPQDYCLSRGYQSRYYEVIRGSARGPIADAPPELLEIIAKANQVEQDPDAVGLVSDDEGTKSRFISYLTNREGADKGTRDHTAYIICAEGRQYGLTQNTCHDLVREYWNHKCTPPLSDSQLKGIAQHAYQYAKGKQGSLHPAAAFQGVHVSVTSHETIDVETGESSPDSSWRVLWDVDSKEGYKPTLSNAMNFFNMEELNTQREGRIQNPLLNLIRFNMFSSEIEFTRRAPWHKGGTHQYWTDEDTIGLKLYLSQMQHFNAGTTLFHEVAVAASRRQQYHPVRDWLNKLPKWDGVERCSKLFSYYTGSPNTAYIREVGRCTMIAAVARVFEPGCQHDSMPVLEGEQGTGKSTFVRLLGGDWYEDIQIDPHAKDTIAGMQGAWILEASEMEFARLSDVRALKAFLTRVTDKVRLAYERHPVRLPRQCIFIGTVNPSEEGYLRDTTGNRRFWPVATTIIRNDELKNDRDQLFAEALHRYRSGERWHLTDREAMAQAKKEQKDRVIVDAWDEVIANWVAQTEDDKLPDPFTTENVAMTVLGMAANKLGLAEKRRLTAAMRAAGFMNIPTWHGPSRKNIRIWVKDALGDLSE